MNTKLTDFFPDLKKERIEVINADVYAGLCALDDSSVDCAITSPPYFDQRDYGFQGQIGNEGHYGEYIAKLEAVFGVLKSKLTDKGVFFLNVGDKYLSKYGNSGLGMIPYKLAHFMNEHGFLLVDTLIWHKPNHMPSSIKNRFSNTYEPIFVFAKNENNFFSEFMKNNPDVSNHFSVHLQATPFGHIAVYPEKLVEKLLSFGFPKHSVVLDPFGGSGTTAKAIQNLNQKGCSHAAILIEASEEYVEIIKQRCNLSPKQKIRKVPYTTYEIKQYNAPSFDVVDTYSPSFEVEHNNYIEIFEHSSQLKAFLDGMDSFAMNLMNDGICYIGIKDWTIGDLVNIAHLNERGWIIRNKIVVGGNKNRWFPVFLIVKDTKRTRYKFNLDAVRTSHRGTDEKNWNHIDFVGMTVNDNLSKLKKEGLIVQVNSRYDNNLPKEVIVDWGQGNYTKEMVSHGGLLKSEFKLQCPQCSTQVRRLPYNKNSVACSSCSSLLWETAETMPLIEVENDIQHEKVEFISDAVVQRKTYKKENYEGKFKNTDKKNFGASPGARSSTQDLTFTVKRSFQINQEVIGTLFKKILKINNKSVKKVTDCFPPEYKHTVGHWFRSDMGGSCPTPEDLEELSNHIEIPSELIEILNTRCLSLQTVKKSHKGKNPGDYLDASKILTILEQTVMQ